MEIPTGYAIAIVVVVLIAMYLLPWQSSSGDGTSDSGGSFDDGASDGGGD